MTPTKTRYTYAVAIFRRGRMWPCYEEVPPRKLSGHNVIRSYFDPEYNDEATLSCRVYIVEEDFYE